ncbi:hypothetical protein PoB_007297400 [Plakobranchus ocellatus]|uniref:Uncharacterized protein n=1 Tax=Plakobranchus ocellatus TaxID=259542 RepID=A0AAV4DR45_9GAST|nr:hypothetical protein PoB_007297400 [Plakobranchus ocellatus]
MEPSLVQWNRWFCCPCSAVFIMREGTAKLTAVERFPCIDIPQKGDLGLSCASSSQGAFGGAETCERRDPADRRVGSLFTVPPTPGPVI